jgi:hypothetical protein
VDSTLASLLLDFTGLSDEEAEKVVYQEYLDLYMDRVTHKGMVGVRKTHDGEPVMFYEDRFEHAFRTSAHKTFRQCHKGKFDRYRGGRVRWIAQIIQGNIGRTECWWIPDPDRRDSSGRIIVKRLYVVWHQNYIIWLEPLQTGGWKFSSAYWAGKQYIRKITKRGTCFWRKKISRD